MKPKLSVPIAKPDLLDRLIEDVHEHTFADLPFKRGAEPEQPELGIGDISELREQMKKTMRKFKMEE